MQRRVARAALGALLLACAPACGEPRRTRELLQIGPHASSDGAVFELGRLALDPGASATFGLELRGAATLRLTGSTSGPGELALKIREFSPSDGREQDAGRMSVRADDGRLEDELELEARAGGVLLVDLSWTSPAAARAELSSLALDEPVAEQAPIVLLSVDTLAARHMSLHGYERATTPNLERLAGEAVVFERCLANAPFTPPSYASQFSGLLPCSTWIDPLDFRRDTKREPKKYETWNLPTERWTLAESLKAAGYRTAAFVDNPMASPAFGFDQGFELYDMSAQQIKIGNPDGGIRHIVPLALEWIAGIPEGEPYFLFINVLDVHGPYGPPKSFRGRFAPAASAEPSRELPVCPEGHEVFGAIPDYNAYSLTHKPFPERLPVEPMIELYDEEILFVDSVVAEFVETLRGRGVLDRSAFVLSADHGEVMADGPFNFGHGVHAEENLHVPFLLRLPGGQDGGTRVSAPVQLLDLYPTLLELAGREPRAYLHGRSLLGLSHGQGRASEPIVHEGGLLESSAVTDGDWRLVEWQLGTGIQRTRYSAPEVKRRLAEHAPELYADLWGSGDWNDFLAALERNGPALRAFDATLSGVVDHELFDVARDPHQLHDLSDEHPEIVERLRHMLDEGRERSRRARQLLTVRPTDLDGWVEPSELRVLGYVGEE